MRTCTGGGYKYTEAKDTDAYMQAEDTHRDTHTKAVDTNTHADMHGLQIHTQT